MNKLQSYGVNLTFTSYFQVKKKLYQSFQNLKEKNSGGLLVVGIDSLTRELAFLINRSTESNPQSTVYAIHSYRTAYWTEK